MRAVAAGVIAAAAFAGPAAAQWSPEVAAELWARSQQRGADQASNPDYLARIAPFSQQRVTAPFDEPDRPQDVDPFRLDWAPARGRELDVSIRNRYGARMHGHLSFQSRARGRRLPVVIALPGGTGTEHAYRGMAQGLAEAGYVVLGVSVQGDAASQKAAPDPVPGTPENEYCRPSDFGGWQQPQEMGIRELGPCAGEDPPAEEPASTVELAELLASHGTDGRALDAGYQRVRARKTFGALDAVAWLASDANPVRDLVDLDRVGIMGHSLGAHGALLAGNGDPRHRFRAVVTLDGFGSLADAAEPTVPTLFQHADGNDFGPWTSAPDPEVWPGHRDARRFAAADVPTGVVVLAGSTHQDFSYVPAPLSQAPIALNASRDGERVALHYTLAWFDRWLGRGRPRRAVRRLRTRSYGGRVDRSSIGQGYYDPAERRNAPPTIAGETAAHHLSPLFASWLDLGRRECADLRNGC